LSQFLLARDPCFPDWTLQVLARNRTPLCKVLPKLDLSLHTRSPFQTQYLHNLQKFGLQDIFAFLVLLAGLGGLVVLPPHCLIALLAHDVPHDVYACGHFAFYSLLGDFDVDDAREKEGFAVLTAELLDYSVSYRESDWKMECEVMNRYFSGQV
jgi:hypothetical protein